MIQRGWRKSCLLAFVLGLMSAVVPLAHAESPACGLVEHYNSGVENLTLALHQANLQPSDARWVVRQHRALRLRMEFMLAGNSTCAAKDVLDKEIRALLLAVDILSRPVLTTQNTH